MGLNNSQWLVWHKTKPNKTKPNQTIVHRHVHDLRKINQRCSKKHPWLIILYFIISTLDFYLSKSSKLSGVGKLFKLFIH